LESLGALSYRRSFDGAEYFDGNGFLNKTAIRYSIVGVNFNKFMVAYTYSHVTGPIKFDTGGYHQITLVELVLQAGEIM
jgi:hypothetical protein